MRNKSILVIICMAFLIMGVNFVQAEPAIVEIIETAGDIEVGGEAVFKLRVTNAQPDRDVLKIVGDEFAVYPFSEFAALIAAEPSQVKLNPEESAEIVVRIKTLDTAKINTKYISKIKVVSLINPEEKTIVELETFLVSARNVIEIIPKLPEFMIPGQTVTIPLELKNRAYIPLKNIEVYVSSDVPNIAEKVMLDFKEREKQSANIDVTFGELTPAGTHVLDIRAYEGGELRGSFTYDLKIQSREQVLEEQHEETGFLTSVVEITKINRGNTVAEQRMETQYSLFKKLFTSAEPEPLKERGKYVWEFTLKPGEETTIKIMTNYRPVLYGFIFIILFVIGMLVYIEKSMVVKKRIFRIKEEEHGISEFKILLHVRNGRRKTVRDVKVMDILPHVVQATNDFGSLQPTTIQKGKISVRLVWELGDLDPKEERVLSYKVKSKMNLLGEVRLPAARAHFLNPKGKIEEVKSLRLRVLKK